MSTRSAFPSRTPTCAQDPKVPYDRMTALEDLARVTFADANEVRATFYDGQPLVEVYEGGRARVMSREQVMAVQ